MIKFFIPGEPVAKARARHRHITTKAGRSFMSSYTPKKTKDFEDLVAFSAKSELLKERLNLSEKPVSLELVLMFAIPDSWPLWKREAAQKNQIAHTVKPDADNVVKAIKDGLNGVVYQDDSQVIEVNATKIYSKSPGVLVKIEEINLNPAQISRKDQLITFDNCKEVA